MTTFEQAMLARDRTLAIRVGKYQSSDINEAAFSYGYIAGDTFKPGGTCAGSGKIILSSIITTFQKLDKIYPEIGLLVDDNYEWIKMGEYFINDIKIDRNRSKTELELMDGMFKFNQPYVSDLSYPAQIRDVIREICKKTGVELQTENLGLRAIQQHIPKKPDKKDITFREVLSQAVQLLGFSAFFNREGKLEIRGLTESGITITADSYFLHGLTKSETEYQIAGITCKKTDKEVLTVGLRTGRSLELENSFMNQNILDDLYYDLKNLKYYPFSLNYQGHLKLQVGQWVTIKTNKNEIFKVPVLSQSFSFKGGLSSRISADSKAGSDTQYSYSGFIQRRINQVSTDMRAEVQQQLEWAEKEFDKKQKDLKDEIKTGIEQAKAKAEQVKSEINQSIEQKLQQTKSEVVEKVKQDFNQGLANANAEISKVKQNLTNLQNNSEATTKQLKSDLVGIRTKQSEAEAEINKQVQALTKTKDELAGVKSAQATFEQTATRKLAELTNLTNGKAERSYVEQTSRELLSKIASVSVGGRNLFLNSLFKQDIKKTGIWTTSTYAASTDSANKYLGHSALKIVGQDPVEKDGNNPKITYPALGMFGEVVAGSATDRDVVISFYAKSAKNGTILLSRLGNVGYADNQNVSLTTEIKHYVVKIPRSATKNAKQATNEWLFRLNQADTIWIWMPKFEFGTVDTAYSEAPEDTDSQITAVESSFKQRADSIEAGVSSLREGLKTKADSSALSLLSDRLQASVKSLETDTQNKLNQKLSTAEFEVRATGIRQEIVNATKDKADKSLVTAEAGKIREEISRISVGGRNLLKGSKGEFKPDRNPSNFDNWQVFYASEIYLEEGKQYIISGKTDGIFSNNHQSLIESDNVILWFLNKSWTVTQIVSGPDTGTTGTKFIWNKPSGTYHLRVNTYHKDARKKVWEVKVERGTIKTDWSPAPEDVDEQITVAKTTLEKTAEGLRTDMTAVKNYVADDGKRKEQLEQYTRTETARSTEALRKQVSESYVAKSQHTEDVRGIARRFEELVIGGNNLLAYANLNEGGYYQNTLKQDPAYIYSNLIEIKNKNYCLQVWELRSIEKKNWVGIQYFDESKKPLANGYSTFWFNGYLKQLLKVPENAKYLAISLDKRALNKDEIKFKLELGSIPSDWSPAPEDSKNYTNTKLAEYKQTVDGEFKKLQSSVGEMVKKTDINITPGQISFGTGKVVNGKTIASLFVQNPESIEAITKLMRITGDLIVDGSITGRDLAANTITTAHLAAGAVTTEVLAADAVTAKKLRVDYALINKLTADDALLNNLVAKQAFINKLSTIDFSATQIKGGLLRSLNNATTFDLTTGDIIFSDTEPSILRKKSGYPHGMFSMSNSIYEDEKAIRITLQAGNIKDSTGSDPWREATISITNTTSKSKGSTIAIKSGDEIYLYTRGKIFLGAEDDLLTGKNGKGFSIYTLKRCVDFILDKTDLKKSWDSQEEWWGK
nr:PblB-type receptor binding protein [uncultured phage]